jgi:hypothetical protein
MGQCQRAVVAQLHQMITHRLSGPPWPLFSSGLTKPAGQLSVTDAAGRRSVPRDHGSPRGGKTNVTRSPLPGNGFASRPAPWEVATARTIERPRLPGCPRPRRCGPCDRKAPWCRGVTVIAHLSGSAFGELIEIRSAISCRFGDSPSHWSFVLPRPKTGSQHRSAPCSQVA